MAMKSEAEIRAHVENLKYGLNAPCSCSRGHSMECAMGAQMMTVAVMELEWALGIDPDGDARVARLAEQVKYWRAKEAKDGQPVAPPTPGN